MLHGYCIRLAEHPPPDAGLSGVDGKPVAPLERGGLVIWVSASTATGPSMIRLREHERIVRSALRSATPLPLRFGTVFSDERDALDTLDARHQEFERLLREMSDRVEMGLRIIPLEEPGPGERVDEPRRSTTSPGSPGREYLEARRRVLADRSAEMETARALVDQVDRSFEDLGLPSVRSVLRGSPPVGSLAHLVQRRSLSAYHRRVEQVARGAGGARIEVSGPWAPYSFVR